MPEQQAKKPRKPRSDGQRSRRTILEAASQLASVEGVEGLTIGRLAEAIGMSKSGLYAHFGSKRDLQLATIDEARALYIKEVIVPVLAAGGSPRERLRRLAASFLSYVERRVFPGGCFFAAVAAEVGARPGPVRERIAAYQQQWIDLLARTAGDALAAGELPPGVDGRQLAFEINALLVAANTAFMLHEDRDALERARRGVEARIGPPA